MAFTDGPFEAYEKLKRFKWTGESVDVYANTIKRLAELAGYVGIGLDQTAKLAFVTGFPGRILKRWQRVHKAMHREIKLKRSRQAFSALDVEDHTILRIVRRHLELK